MSINIAILVSGRGSNLEAILRAIKDDKLEAKAHVVISNNPEALALHIARKYGVHAVAIASKGLSREDHERLVLEELAQYKIDFVVLAGYMRVLSPGFLQHYRDPRGFFRVINIHPSLLPAFPGVSGYDDAFHASVPHSGVTIHLVDEQVDHGPILAQETFPRLDDDTPDTFKARGLAVEHRLYPAVLQKVASDGIGILAGSTMQPEPIQDAETNDTRANRSAAARGVQRQSEPSGQNHGPGGQNHGASACTTLRELCLAVVPRAGFNPNKKLIEFPLYWLQSEQSGQELKENPRFLETIAEILTDPLLEDLWCALPDERAAWVNDWAQIGFRWWAERQFLPGVTDNLAHTVQEALELSGFPTAIKVASGTGFLISEQGLPDAGGGASQAPAEAAGTPALPGAAAYRSPDGGRGASHAPAGGLQGRSRWQRDPAPTDRAGLIGKDGHAQPDPAPTESAGSEGIIELLRYRYFHPLTDRLQVHDLASAAMSHEKFLSFPAVHLPEPKPVEVIALNVSDADLMALSRNRTLALNLQEMQAIRNHFEQQSVRQPRESRGLPAWPTDVELEIIAQTWSEHCKHKIFNAKINHTDLSKPEALQKTSIKSLYKTYIQAATKKLSAQRSDLLSVFVDNAGVVKWDDEWGVCFKVETHNSPSALEPYGGALTGILGVNRDILGTGLGAKPICNTDIFCFAYPSPNLVHRPSMLPAEAIIQGVRRGVQDGGNKSGIPTVNGAVFFHDGYRAKPLVFCGTVGLLPLAVDGVSGYQKHTRSGDTVVMAGGRVGKDGIHGATFSSEALHEGSPVSAVQIGDPFTQKRLADFVLEARDEGLITGITDNGAGGLSSSVGEMAELTGGATIELSNIPLKYPGLADYEIVISESQERMTLSTRDFAALKKLADKHHVEITAIGQFHGNGHFEVTRNGHPVAMLDLPFLHGGVPTLELESVWKGLRQESEAIPPASDLAEALLQLLGHPNISSRETVIRQYDHEVQGASVVKQLMGLGQQAPCDAAVIKPILNAASGVAISNGLCPQLSAYDCYLMAVCAVDEAVRNAVCVGADPASLALLDNFCWPDPVRSQRNADAQTKLAQLVRACEGLFDAVLAYGAPLISGKDSMKNDFDDGVVRISIPPTLLVSAIGRVDDTRDSVTMEFKNPGDVIYIASAGDLGLAGTTYAAIQGSDSSLLPWLDLAAAARLYKSVHSATNKGWIQSCHDLSEGGLAVALAECAIGSELGAELRASQIMESAIRKHTESGESEAIGERLDLSLFAEGPGRLLISVSREHKQRFEELFSDVRLIEIGAVSQQTTLRIVDNSNPVIDVDIEALTKAWKARLPFDGDGVCS